MLKNYLSTAARSFIRRKGLSFINLLGLSTGLACCLLILVYVQREASFDAFHPDADRIYRIINEDSLGASLNRNAISLGLLAPRLEESIASIDASVRIHNRGGVIKSGSELFRENDFIWADSNVFSIFDFPLAQGHPESALTRPNTVVLSRELASRLFGDTNPIGETITVDSKYTLEVTGVLAPPVGPSHIRTGALASMSTLDHIESKWDALKQGWSYVRLAPGSDAAEVEASINANLADYVTWFRLDGMYLRVRLQPLEDVRLHSSDIMSAGNLSDIRYVTLFSAIGILILLLACINFTNLAMARSLQRTREVGMRKTLGARRGQIMGQFLIESVGMALLALFGALLIMELSLPYVNQVSGQELSVPLFDHHQYFAWFLGIAIITGLIAGSLPALHMSRFVPADVLKGGTGISGRGMLRKVLVTGQFAISCALIFAALGIRSQMDFIRNQNLGFETEHIVSIHIGGVSVEEQTLKDAVLNVPGVLHASHSIGMPLNGGMISSMQEGERRAVSKRLSVDEDYLATMGLEMALGVWPDRAAQSDETTQVVVNEEYVRFKGWEDPLQESVVVGYDETTKTTIPGPVVGVVKDFHTGSAYQATMPTRFDFRPSMAQYRHALLVRMTAGSAQQTVDRIRDLWTGLVPDKPFQVSFVDEQVQAIYASETRLAKLFNIFTMLAVGIACLGLFGLAAYSAELRTKEIGIRKVLGASTSGIVRMISWDFLRLVLVAGVIAIPPAWFGMEKWLSDFVYRIQPGPGMVLVSVGLVVLLAWCTVAWQSIRAATTDPVDCLRME